MSEVLATLQATIQGRRDQPRAGSYTCELFAAGRARILQKVGEEAVEVVLAGALADDAQFLYEGADLIFVWGGDGTVQLCIHGLAGRRATLAILPGGTGNILAHNLGIPQDLAQAVHVGLHGTRRPIDTGTVNGERFAAMAGAGLDALMMRDTDDGMKDRIGPAAYLLSGAGSMGAPRVMATIVADGRPFFRGELAMVLVGNVAKTLGGLLLFKDAEPDDGILDLCVVTADSALDWARTMGRLAMGSPEESSFVEVTRGRRFEIRFAEPFLYEVDGNPRRAVKRLRIAVQPASISLCVPDPTLGEAPTATARTETGARSEEGAD